MRSYNCFLSILGAIFCPTLKVLNQYRGHHRPMFHLDKDMAPITINVNAISKSRVRIPLHKYWPRFGSCRGWWAGDCCSAFWWMVTTRNSGADSLAVGVIGRLFVSRTWGSNESFGEFVGYPRDASDKTLTVTNSKSNQETSKLSKVGVAPKF